MILILSKHLYAIKSTLKNQNIYEKYVATENFWLTMDIFIKYLSAPLKVCITHAGADPCYCCKMCLDIY
jgi:hypothetical protein